MNEFLNRVVLDNTIRVYLIVLAVILFMIIVKRHIAQYAAALIFVFVRTIWKDVDKKSFSDLVIRPLGFFLVILVSIATLNKLKFPEVLDFDIYRMTLRELVHDLGTVILVVAFIRLLIRMIDFIALLLHIKADRVHDTSDHQLIVFFKDFFKVILSVIGLLMILKLAFGYNISNLLTGLSIVGAAIALSLRESLENLIASFIIFFDKPFTTGDVVKVNSFSGTVEKVGLRSTRIRTDQKTFITVPNKQMVDSILDNLSQRTQRKGELRLEIGLDCESDRLQQLITGIRKVLNRPEIENNTVLLNDISSTAFVILVEYFTGPVTMQEYNSIKEQTNFAILRTMEEMKIEIAGASMDIRLAKPLNEN
ncbi:MAG: mechanosensitive ion channel domain-containing protein [Chitinophagaceae bacterium]